MNVARASTRRHLAVDEGGPAPPNSHAVRHEQTKSVGANLGAITVLVRRPEPPNRRAQAIIILPGTQFSPARQVPLAELHAPSDRLPRDQWVADAMVEQDADVVVRSGNEM